ncbi:MAG TPA: ribonucleotide-diphosphate reductase subunit alpha, partial [Deltaproteobacteria bacterium]|nr:ribonucleotide-diphosphate reductase subunit alpha [Deltaproteobacteria bacterium]
MGQVGKMLVTEEGVFDLDKYRWDDRKCSDLLLKENLINTDQAMDISKFLSEQIASLNLQKITLPFIENMIEAKLLEYGLTKTSPVRLDRSIFKKKGLRLSENAQRVLERRYLKKDDNGRVIESAEEMFARVAKHIAQAEETFGNSPEKVEEMEKTFYKLMTEFKFLPNSPTLMNAGRELGQLAACFVLPIE